MNTTQRIAIKSITLTELINDTDIKLLVVAKVLNDLTPSDLTERTYFKVVKAIMSLRNTVKLEDRNLISDVNNDLSIVTDHCTAAASSEYPNHSSLSKAFNIPAAISHYTAHAGIAINGETIMLYRTKKYASGTIITFE